MAEIEVTGTAGRVDLGATGLAEVVQNVRTILATRKGTVPLDRDFGTDWTFLDQPTPRAMSLAIAEIVRTVERYEPRVKVAGVTFKELASTETMDGRLVPVVRLTLNV